ncbi:hypothetical protein N7494_006771 [Penicillium frequentans]|uniref:Uncharacterized protein n=1 Tax=Penicillium frequentans TaxID=3151616 RepID=A0AAD6GH05_9EURO|nr:hypothetical protein N7494_006771 [Penicillium glabrum]
MARIKNGLKVPNSHWIAQRYRDHANHPAVLMVLRSTNPESLMLPPLPGIAIQVYSTIPLDSDSDYITLCQYLISEAHQNPHVSFEIYAPQPDVFACVEHQRREILHRKHHLPGEGFFPGIAKVAANDNDRLLQGFLIVITSHSFRAAHRRPDYEAESGPLWVNFNRSFPPRAKVDLRSLIDDVGHSGFDPSTIGGDDWDDWNEIYWEREELMVKKCRNMYHQMRELASLLGRSHCDIMNFEFDYGLDEDEGDPSLADQIPALEIIESLERKADSLHHKNFDIQVPSREAVLITSTPTTAAPESDLHYIIHIAFSYEKLGFELMCIAQAFTAAVIDNIPDGKTISFEFFSASQSLGDILASHRDSMNSRPEIAIGAIHQGSRNFPQSRSRRGISNDREPYRTFLVIIDRPDFLTEPGVLFFLTDGNEITDEAMQKIYNLCGPKDERGSYKLYQVWRSAGMAEVALRLAMIPPDGIYPPSFKEGGLARQ